MTKELKNMTKRQKTEHCEPEIITTHHTSPSKPVQKSTMDMAALEDRGKDQKNRKHQHQMWPGKENSIPSGKRNSRGWCFFFEKKKMHNLQYLPSSTLGCREITVSFWLE